MIVTKLIVPTWQERCNNNPNHDGIVTSVMIQARMQEEIDALRFACEYYFAHINKAIAIGGKHEMDR